MIIVLLHYRQWRRVCQNILTIYTCEIHHRKDIYFYRSTGSRQAICRDFCITSMPENRLLIQILEGALGVEFGLEFFILNTVVDAPEFIFREE